MRATGRELAGLGNDTIRIHTDLDFVPQLPHLNNTDALRTYTEQYEYDLLGNIQVLRHRFKPQPGLGDGWTRHYRYAFDELGMNKVSLDVLEYNERAIKTYERVGFRREGIHREDVYKDGRFVNVVRMSLLDREMVDPPPS